MKWSTLGVLLMCFFHAEAQADAPKGSGLDLSYVDAAVRPQDDLYRHLSGKWLRDEPLPGDRARYGSFDKLADDAELKTRAIIEDFASRSDLPAGSDGRKIADLYHSFMDEATIEKLDSKPLLALFRHIDQTHDRAHLPQLMGDLSDRGITLPIAPGVSQDERNSTQYAVHVFQDGLGLPDRDYYLKDDDARLLEVRKAYEAYIVQVLTMLKQPAPAAAAKRILAIETLLAKAQITKVALRDPVKTYNKMSLADLKLIAPAYGWEEFFKAAGIPLQHVQEIIVGTPSFFEDTTKAWAELPMTDIRLYLKWQAARAMSPLLSKRFEQAHFDFYGKALRGIPENRPRWKRAVELVQRGLGESVGREYVERHFPPQAKARMDELVANLMTAYRQSIDGLTWMTPATREAAQAKLAKYSVKIGYPKTWRDYSKLQVRPDDLVGNRVAIAHFLNAREIAHLGQPVDHEEWEMTPQTVNAYYNPGKNEIVFPAAILQPPFFDFQADEAVNYGGIGAVIGHEISHGFDDAGSQFDGDGNLRDWWTKEDHAGFAERTGKLVAQYERYEPIPGYKVNGRLTLGENIADNSGLAIAYKAYRLSLAGKEAPVIDGMSGDQRLYMGWAQVWRGKARDSEAIRLLKVDPHSPAAVRGNAPLVNQPGFYSAFGVKEGDKLYLPEDQRVILW